MKRKRGALRRHLGPIGLSLLASALTAAGFAAFSIADNGGSSGNGGNGGGADQVLPAPPPGAAGTVEFGPRLSAEDRQKMEAFRQCMEENGAPAPPRIDPSQGPPKPPSAEEQQKIQKAYEACKDNLPEALQQAGPPRFGAGPCHPPPGAPPGNQDQSNHPQSQGSGSSP